MISNHRSQELADRLKALQDKAREHGQAIPMRLPADMPLFTVPLKLSRLFNRDLKAGQSPGLSFAA